MPSVQFDNVGRSQTCWTGQVNDMSSRSLLREIRKQVKFASRNVDVDYDHISNKGMIFAGDRLIGSFAIVETEEAGHEQ